MKITCSTERPCINCFAGHVDQCLGPYKEKYAQEIPRWLFDLIDSGDLEPILMHYGEENLRLEFYKLRQERLTPNAELRGAKPIGEASRSNDVLGADHIAGTGKPIGEEA